MMDVERLAVERHVAAVELLFQRLFAREGLSLRLLRNGMRKSPKRFYPLDFCSHRRARAAIIGCSSLGGGSRRQNIATVIQTAYDLGGREMHLRRDAPAAKRSGWVSEANCEAAARPRAVRFLYE